jgi:hypothetical protein
MDLALTLHFSSVQLRQINHCRIFLQVLTLADITNASGYLLLSTALQGILDPSRPSQLKWPQYPSLTSTFWQQWKILLDHVAQDNKLHQPLGQWQASPHQHWKWFQSHSQEVFHHDIYTSQWHVYLPLPHTQRFTRQTRRAY